MYVILGASGHTGSVVAQTLLREREKVRVVGRSEERLAPLVNRGAEAFVADASDAQELTKAFQSARAVYALVPPNMSAEDFSAHQGRVANAIAKALESAQITHAVVLSSIGADKESGTGPVRRTTPDGGAIQRHSTIKRLTFASRLLHGKHIAADGYHSCFGHDGRAGSG